MIKINTFSFRNRIAINYIITTGLLVFVAFFLIFHTVKFIVYEHIDKDINEESKRLFNEIVEVDNDNDADADDDSKESDNESIREKVVLFKNDFDWKVNEHNSIKINSIFVQFVDKNGNFIDKTPNLKRTFLPYFPNGENNKISNQKLGLKDIRIKQTPIYRKEKLCAYMLVAISLRDSKYLLENLFNSLVIIYLVVLFILFFLARFIAGRSIKPINSIINTSNSITKDNLKGRIILPQNKDELYILSETINKLLDRIEDTIEREKQFTSDASHELRTPLAVIKGTLEVLIRKPRKTEEYNQKINYCVSEVDRINNLVDQLLLLARFENQKQSVNFEKISLTEKIIESLSFYKKEIKAKNITIINNSKINYFIKTDNYFISIILNNIISNALKYSFNNGKITISIEQTKNNTILKIIDTGMGIKKNEVEKVFDSFYRTTSTANHPEIKGTGLGLSIVKRLSDILNITIEIESEENIGTIITLNIP